jgi:hypothetical protein
MDGVIRIKVRKVERGRVIFADRAGSAATTLARRRGDRIFDNGCGIRWST